MGSVELVRPLNCYTLNFMDTVNQTRGTNAKLLETLLTFFTVFAASLIANAHENLKLECDAALMGKASFSKRVSSSKIIESLESSEVFGV